MVGLEDAILSQYGLRKLRCIKKGSVDGVEVGDRCVADDKLIIPVIRYFPESGEEKPFKAISVEDAKDFEFIPL
jgi:hypothetical protein